MYDLQIRNIDWMIKKVNTLVKQQATKETKDAKARVHKQRARVLTFFKPLGLLLGPVSGRDALRIRTHLEQAIDACGAATQIRTSPAYRTYEKRLVTIAGKDTGLKVAPKKASAATAKPSSKSRDVIEDSDEEMEDAQANGHDEEARSSIEGSAEPGAPEEADEPEEPEEADEPEEDERDEVMDEDRAATPRQESVDDIEDTEATPTKRPRGDDSSLPDLDLHPSDINADEIDWAFGDLSDRERSRSVSVEPNTKRRKITKRY